MKEWASVENDVGVKDMKLLLQIGGPDVDAVLKRAHKIWKHLGGPLMG